MATITHLPHSTLSLARQQIMQKNPPFFAKTKPIFYRPTPTITTFHIYPTEKGKPNSRMRDSRCRTAALGCQCGAEFEAAPLSNLRTAQQTSNTHPPHSSRISQS